jgi:Domain of unknown function (DUF3291)
MAKYQIAQVNIGRIKAELEDPLMAGFVARLDEINALADGSPGFVWRLQTPEGNNTYLRPCGRSQEAAGISRCAWGDPVCIHFPDHFSCR